MKLPISFEKDGNSIHILRALMDSSDSSLCIWSASDLASILEHQLSSPLASAAERFAAVSSLSRGKIDSALKTGGRVTFEQALRSRKPDRTLLRMIKEYGKASITSEEDLPRDAARTLYVAAVLIGRIHFGEAISRLSQSSIEREVRRCLTFPWLPKSMRELLRDNVNRL